MHFEFHFEIQHLSPRADQQREAAIEPVGSQTRQTTMPTTERSSGQQTAQRRQWPSTITAQASSSSCCCCCCRCRPACRPSPIPSEQALRTEHEAGIPTLRVCELNVCSYNAMISRHEHMTHTRLDDRVSANRWSPDDMV